jgi:hypothetical protein
MSAGVMWIAHYLRRAAVACASLCLVAAVASAEDRYDQALRALLAGLDGDVDELLLEAPASPDAIAGRVETLLARLAALQPAPQAEISRNVAEVIARAGRAALRTRPVLPMPETIETPPGAVRFTNDMAQVDGMRLPLPNGSWRLLVFSESNFGREAMVNGRRVRVGPGAGVLLLDGVEVTDGSATVAFPTPRDLIQVVAEPVPGPSLLGDALPTPEQAAAAQARIDAALAKAVPQRMG